MVKLKLTQDQALNAVLHDPVRKHSVMVAQHKTAISLEDVFWDALKEIAADLGIYLKRLLEKIDEHRGGVGLSVAVRKFVLLWVQGHRTCGL